MIMQGSIPQLFKYMQESILQFFKIKACLLYLNNFIDALKEIMKISRFHIMFSLHELECIN